MINCGGWLYYTNPDEAIPVDDLRPHVFGAGCWCRPEVIDWRIAHQALDRREDYESGMVRLN